MIFRVFMVLIALLSVVAVEAAEHVFPNLSFTRPVFLTSAQDASNRLFVVEPDGIIYHFPHENGASTKNVFLNISDLIISPARGGGSEEGLLGLAFAPEFKTNQTFYVYYSAGSPRRSVIARLKTKSDNPQEADLSTLKVILEIPQPYSNYNGGMMAFGKDQMLYVGLGDGGSGGDPQNHSQR